jgi:hypothetical protein
VQRTSFSYTARCATEREIYYFSRKLVCLLPRHETAREGIGARRFSKRRSRGVDVLTTLALWGVTSLFFFVWA